MLTPTNSSQVVSTVSNQASSFVKYYRHLASLFKSCRLQTGPLRHHRIVQDLKDTEDPKEETTTESKVVNPGSSKAFEMDQARK